MVESLIFFPTASAIDDLIKGGNLGPFHFLPVPHLFRVIPEITPIPAVVKTGRKVVNPGLKKWSKDQKALTKAPPGVMFTAPRPGSSQHSLSTIGAYLAKFVVDSGLEEKHGQMIWYKPSRSNPLLIFDNLEIKQKVEKWFQEFDVKGKVSEPIFASQDDFNSEVSSSGRIMLEAKVKFKMDGWEEKILTKAGFLAWRWLKDHATARYWYWNGQFFFEKKDDAVLFKLSVEGAT